MEINHLIKHMKRLMSFSLSEGMAPGCSLQFFAVETKDGAQIGRACAWRYVGGDIETLRQMVYFGDALSLSGGLCEIPAGLVDSAGQFLVDTRT